MAKYNYKPLDIKKKEIRLVHLLPGSADDVLKLHIVHVPFVEAKKLNYEALSYTWGSEDNPQTIQISRLSRPNTIIRIRRALKDVPMIDEVDSGQLSVTTNLAAALLHLRQSDRPLRLWIDAICIDQENLREKAIEVDRMGDIYRYAGSVLIWLGPKSEDSDLAIDTLLAVSHYVKDFGEDSTLTYVITQEDQKYPWKGTSDEEYNARRAAVRNLLNRPWFGRLWIWQEVGLPTSAAITMICGSMVLQYSDFRKAILMASGLEHNGESLHHCLDENTRNSILRMVSLPRQSPDLSSLLDFTKYAMCKDSRDRIYALKSLLSINMQVEIKPDYTKTAEEVFKDVALSCLKVYKNLELLVYCEMPFPSKWKRSWVPNLSSPRITSSINFGSASGDAMAEALCSDEQTLQVNGVHVSSITEVLCVFPRNGEGGDMQILSTLQKVTIELFAKTSTEEEKVAWALCFISLMTCDHSAVENFDRNGSTTPEFYRQDLLTFVNVDLEKSSLEELSKIELVAEALRNVSLRAIFKTNTGCLGLGPAVVKVGDHTCALLGCTKPLVLRPVLDRHDDYQVVGQSFIREFIDKQAFVGPISRLVTSWCSREAGKLSFMYMYNGITTEEDPRLGPLPHGWSVYVKDYSKIEPLPGFEQFPETRRLIKRSQSKPFDIRMSSEQLMFRGVDIKTFNLV